jgi:hypothetical protein
MTLDDFHKLEAKAQQVIEATDAASAMAMRRWHDPPLPRAARIWTGMLAGKRAWRGMPVILPDKSIGFIFGIRRGWAAIWRAAPFTVSGRKEFVLRVEQIKPYRLPSAVRLAQCKRGRKEQPSSRKAAACRKNGSMPCHPGKRRGRPRKVQSFT